MRLQISKSKNAESFYVVKSVYENKRRTNVIVEKLGTLAQVTEKANGLDPYLWAKDYVDQLNKNEALGKEPLVISKFAPAKIIEKDIPSLFNGGYLFLQQIYHCLGINNICKSISSRYKFEFDLDSILSRLIYGRILSPSSKLSTLSFSKSLLESPNFELHHIYRALEVLSKENDFIQSELYLNSLKISKRNDRILYYDCTNFFFEIEDEDNFRKYGVSKENRPNPIVNMGLFLDGDGIPLAFSINPGNTNENITLKPLEHKIIKDFKHSSFIVCTDAGLSSTVNRKFNSIGNRSFVTTQSIKKLKPFLKEWALDLNNWYLCGDVKKELYNLKTILSSEELTELYKDAKFYKTRPINEDNLEQTLVVTFSIKYMRYQRHIREKQLNRALKLVNNPGRLKANRPDDPNRFIQKQSCTPEGEIATVDIYSINEDKYLEESKYDGFYAVATNLDDSPEDIVKINSGRWEIEESFRIMKSEFKSRPVYLSREDRIKAHFITCFLSLVIFRYLEKNLEYQFTCDSIISTIRGMYFKKIDKQGYIPAYTRTDITDALHEQAGFRTDYEILTTKALKNIKKLTTQTK